MPVGAHVRRAVAALVLLGGLLLSVAPASAADSPRCAVAGTEVRDGHPRSAAALVDEVRTQLDAPQQCASQAAAASAAITSADDRAEAAARALAAIPEGADDAVRRTALTEVRARAQAAHTADLDNARAASVLDEARTGLREIETGATAVGRVDARSASWATFVSTSGAGLVRLGAVAVSTLLLILLIARLLLLAPARWGRLPLHPPRWLSWAPLALVVDLVAGAATAWWLADVWTALGRTPSASSGAHPFLLAVVLLVAVVLTWGWLFHRGRVAITMQLRGAENPAGAAAVVGHLRSLGAAPPRGLELPLGGDAQTLNGSNISAPVLKGVLGGVLAFFQSALAVTPWRVLVDTDSDEQTVAIVSRHGRVQSSAVIRRDLFGPDGPTIDPLKLVAALALLTILDSPRARHGLGGAQDWRSVGLQYDAVTGNHPHADLLRILAKAVDRDPGSWLARMSYRVALSLRSEDAEELRELSEWLRTAAAQQPPGDEALRVRMLYSAYAAHLNHLSLMRSEARACSCPGAKVVANELQSAIDRLWSRDRAFAVQVREAKRALDAHGAHQIPRISEAELSPRTAFTYACFWAEKAAETLHPAEVDDAHANAIDLLKFSVTDSTHAQSAATDHMLKQLRATDTYRRAFAASPRTELSAIAPFDAHRKALAAAGLTEAALISLWPLADLGAALGCSVDVARVVRDKAALVLAVPSGPWIYPLEVVDALATLGIDDVARLDEVRHDPLRRPTVAATITAVCAARGLPDPDGATIDRWLMMTPRTVAHQRVPS